MISSRLSPTDLQPRCRAMPLFGTRRRPNAARASMSMVRDSRSWAWAFASPMRAFKPAPASKSYGPRNSAVSRVNGAGNGSGKKKPIRVFESGTVKQIADPLVSRADSFTTSQSFPH
ncbi:uncharacterized protein A4U43_C09F15960 [Asparagus officinalis]|uniref:Uncharacterized protein n=1 Tax=Asparagus officinalis TaxID=4686 RepID=A0A5P1E8B5_ASPOF|nr:uncharacterized protein A4U43_C09F15960 [Asparagus officinalis]